MLSLSENVFSGFKMGNVLVLIKNLELTITMSTYYAVCYWFVDQLTIVRLG